MTRAALTPFRVPYEQALPSAGWHRIRDGVAAPLEADDWDPATDLQVRATIGLDHEAFREACGLNDGDQLLAILSWSDSATRIGGAAPLLEISDERTLVLEALVPGSEVAGRIEFRAAIVLGRGQSERPFVASEPGAILWSDHESLNLAGTATRFPVEVVDFGEIPGRNPNAPWFLDWDPHEPDMPILGGLRLQLNSRSPRVVEAVKSSSAAPESGAIREFIAFDVARAIVHGALAHWQPDDIQEADPSTVGALVKRLLDTLFSGKSLEALQSQHEMNVGEVDVQIAGALRTLSGASKVAL